MSLSMLLNAANVVKAAERCKAIDETNGRIPINFLLSRSNDLDDQVKHQLQQLAVSSPSISLNSTPPGHPAPPPALLTATSPTAPNTLPSAAAAAAASSSAGPASGAVTATSAPAADADMPPRPDSPRLPACESLRSLGADELLLNAAGGTGDCSSSSSSETDEDAALRDIDDASTSQAHARADRKLLRLGKNLGAPRTTLTRKAIRKHSAAVEPSAMMLHMPLLPPRAPVDGTSTIHTTSAASQPSSSSISAAGGLRIPVHVQMPTFPGRRDAAAASAAAAAAASGSRSEGEGEGGGMGMRQGNAPRRRWKQWEDELLIQVVQEHGPSRWNTLARHFPGRNGRQVRLRWMNHLQPSLDKRPWRRDEDAVLLEAHNALGNKWALISMRLCGRTDNSVKNRYKSIVRRAAREAKARKQTGGSSSVAETQGSSSAASGVQ